ncbi:MAG: RNase adapter RapZ [Pseudomonadota bacterium]
MSHPIIVISGLSGSGKSVALHALEDLSYYCVDNLPGGLLADLIETVRNQPDRYPYVAIGIDARTGPDGLEKLMRLFEDQTDDQSFRVLFLDADQRVLVRRFSETRRRHPLAGAGGLEEAIATERALLEPLRQRSDWVVDTSETNIHQLRRQIWRSVGQIKEPEIPSVVIESFAFKRGVPRDVDLVFDARCLPNPHWEPELRARTGLDPEVADYLSANPRVQDFREDVLGFIRRWLPALAEDQRSLLTIGIGCTGGQHRSVWLASELGRALRDDGQSVVIAHREMES